MKDKEKQLTAVIEKVLRDTQNCDMSIETLTDYLVDRIKNKVFPEDSVVLSKEEFKEKIKQVKDLEKNYYKNVVIPQEHKKIAEKIYRELQGHGTTYIKKWIKKQFGVKIKED